MKIPSHAERVFKGAIFDVYQWQQPMFDGTTATFECLRRPNTAVVIPMVGEDILYSEQEQPGKPPYVALFGGRVEEGEDPLEGAKRELLEETGLASTDWQLLFSKEFGGKIDWTVYYYLARDCKKVAEPHLDGGEKITVLKAHPEYFLSDVVSHPKFAEIELKTRIFSSFNEDEAEKFLAKLKA